MKAPRKFVLIAAIAGVVSGFALATVISRSGNEEPISTFSSHSTKMWNEKADTIADSRSGANIFNKQYRFHQDQLLRNEEQLRRLEQRVDRLAALMQSEDASKEDATDFEAQAAELSELTPEEAKARDLEWWTEIKAAFEHEAIDEEWANTTNQLFQSDISKIADDKGFSLIYSECRSTQCAAILRWPSYSEAALGFTHLLHHTYEANCARHTLLPEPDELDAHQPYEMTIIFDCSEWRNQL